MTFWYPAAVELKSFGFSCVVIGKQYTSVYFFVLVSYFHFEMFGIMADIFPLATFSFLAFAICVFSHCICLLSAQLAIFKFALIKRLLS